MNNLHSDDTIEVGMVVKFVKKDNVNERYGVVAKIIDNYYIIGELEEYGSTPFMIAVNSDQFDIAPATDKKVFEEGDETRLTKGDFIQFHMYLPDGQYSGIGTVIAITAFDNKTVVTVLTSVGDIIKIKLSDEFFNSCRRIFYSKEHILIPEDWCLTLDYDEEYLPVHMGAKVLYKNKFGNVVSGTVNQISSEQNFSIIDEEDRQHYIDDRSDYTSYCVVETTPYPTNNHQFDNCLEQMFRAVENIGLEFETGAHIEHYNTGDMVAIIVKTANSFGYKWAIGVINKDTPDIEDTHLLYSVVSSTAEARFHIDPERLLFIKKIKQKNLT